jgi:hypothetical protein
LLKYEQWRNKMFRRRILATIVIGLLIIGLLSLGGYIGWSQGYAMGRLASGEAGAGAPAGAVGPYLPYYGVGFFPFFWGIGLVFKIGFFLLFFFLIAKFFRFFAWRMAGGARGPYWGGPKQWHHGPKPPWWRDWEEADAEAGDTGTGPIREA